MPAIAASHDEIRQASRSVERARRPRPAGSPMRLVALSLSTSAVVAAGCVAAGAAGVLPDDATSAGCWALVFGGVVGTLLAGRGSSWGWLLLVSLQPLWITYAMATEQYGFIFGSVAYGFGQLNGFLRSRRDAAD